MKKVFFILIFFNTFVFSSTLKELKSFEEFEEDKKIFLVFSTSNCIWCSMQKRVLEEIEIEKDNLQIFYVNDTSKIYKELLKKYSFSIKYFPTSYILEKYEKEITILYEFRGFQKKKNILKVLNDEDSF